MYQKTMFNMWALYCTLILTQKLSPILLRAAVDLYKPHSWTFFILFCQARTMYWQSLCHSAADGCSVCHVMCHFPLFLWAQSSWNSLFIMQNCMSIAAMYCDEQGRGQIIRMIAITFRMSVHGVMSIPFAIESLSAQFSLHEWTKNITFHDLFFPSFFFPHCNITHGFSANERNMQKSCWKNASSYPCSKPRYTEKVQTWLWLAIASHGQVWSFWGVYGLIICIGQLFITKRKSYTGIEYIFCIYCISKGKGNCFSVATIPVQQTQHTLLF